MRRTTPGSAVVSDSHIHDQRYEDAMFLIESGASFEETASRIGLTVDALEKLIARHEKRKAS